MRRTKNCIFKYRIEAIFKWTKGIGTFVCNYIEDREKGIVDFDVDGNSVSYQQIKKVARILGTSDIRLIACGGNDEDTYINFEIHGVRFDKQQCAPR